MVSLGHNELRLFQVVLHSPLLHINLVEARQSHQNRVVTIGCFNMKMQFYQYRDSNWIENYTVKIIPWLSYFDNGNPNTCKDVFFYTESRPRSPVLQRYNTLLYAATPWQKLELDFGKKKENKSSRRGYYEYLGKNYTWWHHQMETFSLLLTLYAGNSPVTGEFPSQRPVMGSFDVFFDLCLNKRLNKQSWGWSFEMPSHSLWCHCNDEMINNLIIFHYICLLNSQRIS